MFINGAHSFNVTYGYVYCSYILHFNELFILSSTLRSEINKISNYLAFFERLYLKTIPQSKVASLKNKINF